MEDTNANEWDLNRNHRQAPPHANDGGWQHVTTNRDKGKAKQQAPPAIRQTTNRDTRKHTHPRSKQVQRGSAKWQNARGQAAPAPTPRSAPKLLIEVDDPSQAQWRAHEPAKASIRIPMALLLDGSTIHQTIAQQHGAFLFAAEQASMQNAESQTYGLWGEKAAVENARRALNAWIEGLHTSGKTEASRKFAKLASLTPVLRSREENRWKREVKRQRFRQHPPLNKAFGAIGTFHWPVQEYSPHEILGSSYEALDPIRMECSCYVVWKRDGFQVMGKDMKTIKAALKRLRLTVFQIAAKQLAPLRQYLLTNEKGTGTVGLVEYERPRLLTGPTIDESPFISPRATGLDDSCTIPKQLEKRVHRSLRNTLSKLPYFRGNIVFRAHYGRFLATQYKLPDDGENYDLDEYKSMINESQFHGRTTDEIGDREVEQAALGTLQQGKDLLMPLGAVVSKLSEVKPIYTAVFTFADKAGDLRFTKSWQQAQGTSSDNASFEIVSQKWIRLEKDTGTTTSLVDISLTDLSTSFGWAFTMEAAQSVEKDRLPPALANFADSVKVDVNAALRQATDRPFTTFNPYAPSNPLKFLQQRITYEYSLHDCEYNVALTRFQDIIAPERVPGSILPSATDQKRVYEPRWGLSVYHGTWDIMFAANENLSIGGMTDWGAEGRAWFPKDMSSEEGQSEDVNFGELMSKLQKIGALLGSSGMEDLLGGMTVG